MSVWPRPLLVMMLSSTLVMLDMHVEPGRSSAAGRGRRPNVLIILTDDQPAKRAYYRVMPKTMRLLRKGGTHYVNGVTTTSLCCPARTSLLTGQYVHNHGVKGNSADAVGVRMMPRELQQNGYSTALAGKFLNGWSSKPPGFDKWAMLKTNSKYFNAPFNIQGRSQTKSGYTTGVIKRYALRYLRRFEHARDRKPWFLQVATLAPHGPAIPARRFADARVPRWRETRATSERFLSDKPGYVRRYPRVGRNEVRRFRARQLRSLMSVDRMVGRIYHKLRQLGEARNTLTVFLSDNGHVLFEHRLKGKKFPYNESVRVPFFVKWGRHFAKGEKRRRIVANIDIAPTVYRAANVDPRRRVDGRPLRGRPRKHILIEYLASDRKVPRYRGLWTPRWEYVRYLRSRLWPHGQGREFYRRDDPWQLRNVYGDATPFNDPPRESRLKSWLRSAAHCRGAGCP
ncbi:MAG: sulfatase family protein [Actinomycetota bacterium]